MALPLHTWRRAHVGPALRVTLVVPGPPHVPGPLFRALVGGTASVAGAAAAAVDPPRTVLDHVPPTVCGRANLIKTEYWDRAGGGGNISYDW